MHLRSCHFFIIATVIMFLTASCGCIQQQPITTEDADPIVMDPTTPTMEVRETSTAPSTDYTSDETNYTSDDQRFIDAAEACYQNTPQITNLTTHNTFLKCMQNTSDPTSVCAKSYKRDALKYTNVDDTTAGYQRETHNVHLARSMFFEHMAYNATRQEFEPCP